MSSDGTAPIPPTPFLPRLPGGRYADQTAMEGESLLVDMSMGSMEGVSVGMDEWGMDGDGDGAVRDARAGGFAEEEVEEEAEEEEEESTPRRATRASGLIGRVIEDEQSEGGTTEVDEMGMEETDGGRDDTLPSPFLKLGLYPVPIRHTRPRHAETGTVAGSTDLSSPLRARDSIPTTHGCEPNLRNQEEKAVETGERDKDKDREEETLVLGEMDLEGMTEDSWIGDETMGWASHMGGMTPAPARLRAVLEARPGAVQDKQEDVDVSEELDTTVGAADMDARSTGTEPGSAQRNGASATSGADPLRSARKKRDPPTPPRREARPSSSSIQTPRPDALAPGPLGSTRRVLVEEGTDDYFKRRLVDSSRWSTLRDYAVSSPGVGSPAGCGESSRLGSGRRPLLSLEETSTSASDINDSIHPSTKLDQSPAIGAAAASPSARSTQPPAARFARLPLPRRLMPPTPAPRPSAAEEEAERLAQEAGERFMRRRTGLSLAGRVGGAGRAGRGEEGAIGGLLAGSSIFQVGTRLPGSEHKKDERVADEAEALNEDDGKPEVALEDPILESRRTVTSASPVARAITPPPEPESRPSVATPSRTGVLGFISGFLRRSVSSASLRRSGSGSSLSVEERDTSTSVSASDGETRLVTPSVRSEDARRDANEKYIQAGPRTESPQDDRTSGYEHYADREEYHDHSGEVSDQSVSDDSAHPLQPARRTAAVPLPLPPLPHVPGYRSLTVPRLEGTGRYASSTVARPGAPGAPVGSGSGSSSRLARSARPPVSSAFAAKALARLPPPGQGSSRAGEKVTLSSAERGVDVRRRKEGWERRVAQQEQQREEGGGRVALGERKSVPQSSSRGALEHRQGQGRDQQWGQEQGMKRTVPVAGATPGKGTALRAAKRRAFDEARKEREEMDRLEKGGRGGGGAKLGEGRGVRV